MSHSHNSQVSSIGAKFADFVPAVITPGLTLLGTTSRTTAHFHLFEPPMVRPSFKGRIRAIKERLIRISPLGLFVTPHRYRNKPVQLKLLRQDSNKQITLASYNTCTDTDGQVNYFLTQPGMHLAHGEYQLQVLVPKAFKRRSRKKHTEWVCIGRIPLKLLPDNPPQETPYRAIISDIDGTLYHTAYHSFRQMISTAYTKPSGKVFIEGMPLLLKTFKEEPNTTLHGLSCSPENLRGFIQQTTARAGFEFDTLQLNKSFNATRSRERILYKVTRTLELLSELPQRSALLMIGDNKEQDLQTYELIKELLELPSIDPDTHVTAWAAQVIAVANQVRPGTVGADKASLTRARIEALALTVLAREHQSPDIYILESFRPSQEYIDSVRQMATRDDTHFCDNGHQLMCLILKKQSQVIRQLQFFVHTRHQQEPQNALCFEHP